MVGTPDEVAREIETTDEQYPHHPPCDGHASTGSRSSQESAVDGAVCEGDYAEFALAKTLSAGETGDLPITELDVLIKKALGIQFPEPFRHPYLLRLERLRRHQLRQRLRVADWCRFTAIQRD